MNHCMRHYEEPTVALCRTCQRPFCSRCLVFSFGPNKPPFCVGCALTASGVRNGGIKGSSAPVAEVPSIDRKAERSQRKAEKAAAKAQAKAAKAAARSAPDPGSSTGASGVDPMAPRPSHVPGPSQLGLRTAHDVIGMHPRI